MQGNNSLHIVQQYLKAFSKFPEHAQAIMDSVSDGQLDSKQWLVDQLQKYELGNIFLCGGWLASMLHDHQSLKFTRCISFDLDPTCKPIAEIIHRGLLMDGWKFLAFTQDIHNINYRSQLLQVTRANGTTVDITVSSDTIINTSCEHIENFSDWWDLIPNGKLIAVQSNNGFDVPGHVNCVTSLVDFAKQTPMNEVYYEGEKDMPKFTRYMRIGRK